MHMKNFAGFMAVVITVVLVTATAAWAESEKVSEPFHYSGYSRAAYTGIEKISAYVPMSDGAKLAIDAYIPTGGPDKSFPVIIEYTPYTRAFIDEKNGPMHKMMRKAVLKTDSPVLDMLAVPGGMADAIKQVISHGYIFVRADIRGCGASTGWKADFMPRIGQDGGELVDWIAKQSWCDGNVGMIGGSYSGYSQIVTAGWAGPALKAIAPVVVPLDGYNGEVYPGGIYLYEFMRRYSARLGQLNLNYYTLNPLSMALGKTEGLFLPAAPVVDEDGDGELWDEIPIDKNHNGTFLDDYGYPEDPNDPPVYKDGQPRQHVYYLATKDHEANANYNFWAQNLLFEDARMPPPFSNYTIWDFNPSSQVPKIMKKGIAIYNIGGWFDAFTRGTTEYFCTLRKTNPSRMLIMPTYHGGNGPFWKYFGEDPKSFMKLLLPELLRFFDYYLKGIDNGFAKEPPIEIYVMNGGGFRAESEWPLSRQVITDYFFNPGNSLSTTRGGPGKDLYRADFSHDARFGKTKGNRWLAAMGVTPDELPYRNELDKKCLTYQSEAMQENMEVTGHPIVTFWAQSTATDGDFFVYLEDVDESGKVLLVTENVHRAGFATLSDNDKMIMGGGSGIDVLPNLPWHGYERKDFTPEVFAHGKVVEVHFDLNPTSWVFRKGHAIRVSIAAADWPTFRLNDRLSASNDPSSPTNIEPMITILRDQDHPSGIALPVIPGSSR